MLKFYTQAVIDICQKDKRIKSANAVHKRIFIESIFQLKIVVSEYQKLGDYEGLPIDKISALLIEYDEGKKNKDPYISYEVCESIVEQIGRQFDISSEGGGWEDIAIKIHYLTGNNHAKH